MDPPFQSHVDDVCGVARRLRLSAGHACQLFDGKDITTDADSTEIDQVPKSQRRSRLTKSNEWRDAVYRAAAHRTSLADFCFLFSNRSLFNEFAAFVLSSYVISYPVVVIQMTVRKLG